MFKKRQIEEVKSKARKIGFDEVGFANFDDFNFYSNNLREFIIKKKYHLLLVFI